MAENKRNNTDVEKKPKQPKLVDSHEGETNTKAVRSSTEVTASVLRSLYAANNESYIYLNSESVVVDFFQHENERLLTENAANKQLFELLPEPVNIKIIDNIRKAHEQHKKMTMTVRLSDFKEGIPYRIIIIPLPQNETFIQFVNLSPENLNAEENDKGIQERMLLDLMTQGILYQDDECSIINSNPAALRLLGVTKDEERDNAINSEARIAIRADGSEIPVSEYPGMIAIQTGKPVEDMIMGLYIGADDMLRWLKVTSLPIYDKGSEAPTKVVTILDDITKQIESEEKLKFQMDVLSKISDAVCLLDENHKISLWNKSAEKLFGYTAEEAIGKKLTNVVKPIYPDYPDQDMMTIGVAGSGSWSGEVIFFTKSGEALYVDVSATMMINRFGNPLGILLIAKDVTEKRRALDALKESEQRFRALAETTETGILLVREGQIIYANPAAERMVEAELGSFPRLSEIHFVRDDYKALIQERTRRRLQGDETLPNRYEMPIVTLTGKEKWVDMSVGILQLGGLPVILATFNDITEQKHIEDALRRSEEHYRVLAEALPDTVMIINNSHVVTYANSQAMKYYGIAELGEGVRLQDIFPSDTARNTIIKMRSVIRSGKPAYFEEKITIDAQERWQGTWLVPIFTDKGTVQALMRVSRDITERFMAVVQLQESEERFRSLVNTSQVGIGIFNNDDGLVYVNQNGLAMTGYSFNEISGFKLDTVFVNPEEAVAWTSSILSDNPPKDRYDVLIRRKDGSHAWFSALGSSIIYDGKRCAMVTFMDITERKAYETELRKSEEHYRVLAESMPDSILIINSDMKATYANTTARKSFINPDIIVENVSIYDLYPHSAAEQVEANVRKVFSDGQPAYMEERFEYEDKIVWYGTWHAPIKDENGTIDAVLRVSRDNTRRIESEQALRDSETRFRTLVDSVNIGIAILQNDLQLLYINNCGLKMSGYEEHELLGYGYAKVFIDDENILETWVRQFFTDNPPENSFIIKAKNKQGYIYRLQLYAGIIMYEGKQCLLTTFTDVTDQLNAQETLEQTLEFMRSIYDQIHQPIVVVDVLPDETVRYVAMNPAQERISGIKQDMILGKTPDEVLPKPIAEEYMERYQRCIRTGERITWETRRIFEGEEQTWLGTIAPLKDHDGKVNRIIAIGVNITEQVKAEQRKAELERRLMEVQRVDSLGVLAGGIAHDFNNLLTSILGNIQIALSELEERGDDALKLMLKQIELASKRAAELTNQMLMYSGKARIMHHAVDVNAVIAETLHLIYGTVSRRADLIFKAGDDLPLINGDPVQVRQVVMNLVLNASEAITEGHGKVIISTSLMYADNDLLMKARFGGTAEPGNYLCISVSDTGSGMDADTQYRIFDPFFSTKSSGRGLGLAAVMGILRAHKGVILLDSSVGKGSTFRILLPAIDKKIAPIKLIDDSDKKDFIITGKALVIDDDDGVRNIAVKMLAKLGMTTLEAEDGEKGIALYKEQHSEIAVVLIDIMMPKMRGDKVYEAISAISSDVPVIFISGFDEDEVVTRSNSITNAVFLQKPFTLKALKNKLAEALQMHKD